MNKKFVVLIAILLAIVLSLTLMQSCNKQSTEEAPETAVETEETPAVAVTEAPAKEKPEKSEEAEEKKVTEKPSKAEESKEEKKTQAIEVTPTPGPVPGKLEVGSVKTNEDGSIETSYVGTDSTVVIGVVPSEGVIEFEEEFVPAAPQQPAPTPVPTQAPNDEPLTIPLTEITFEIYNSLSAAQQQSVIDQFGSSSDFMIWYNYIKAEYEAANPSIEIGSDSVIDLSQVGNGN